MTDRDIRLRDLGNKVEEYTKIIPKKIDHLLIKQKNNDYMEAEFYKKFTNEFIKPNKTRAPPSGHGSVIAFDESLASLQIHNLFHNLILEQLPLPHFCHL